MIIRANIEIGAFYWPWCCEARGRGGSLQMTFRFFSQRCVGGNICIRAGGRISPERERASPFSCARGWAREAAIKRPALEKAPHQSAQVTTLSAAWDFSWWVHSQRVTFFCSASAAIWITRTHTHTTTPSSQDLFSAQNCSSQFFCRHLRRNYYPFEYWIHFNRTRALCSKSGFNIQILKNHPANLIESWLWILS